MKNKKIFFYIIILILLSILIYCFYNINKYYLAYLKIQKTTKKMINTYYNPANNKMNFNKMKSINDEIVGWIKVENTNIDYPFVQTNNNEYYLTHFIDKSFNKIGTVFLDYRNNINTLDQNNILYAHGRMDKTMFGSMRNVLDKKWFDETKDKNIYLYTENGYYIFEIFSVYKIKTTDDYLKIHFNNDFQEFINLIKSRSIYDFDVNEKNYNKIITLSTCYNKDYKIVMHGKLIKDS